MRIYKFKLDSSYDFAIALVTANDKEQAFKTLKEYLTNESLLNAVKNADSWYLDERIKKVSSTSKHSEIILFETFGM